MKKYIIALFTPQNHYVNEELVDVQKLHLFRVKLLESILLTVSFIGFMVGLFEWIGVLPEHKVYTPAVILHSLLNFAVYLRLKYSKRETFLSAMHICIFSALLILSIMSMTLTYDTFRFIWFFLLVFASFILGGKWYGFVISMLVLGIIYTQYFLFNLQISPYALFSLTASLLTFNAFALFFLTVTKQDALTLQTHINQEVEKRKNKEEILQKIEEADILNLKNGYFWDSKRKILTHKQSPVSLTQKEQLLLALLIEKKEQCVTFEDIQANVWQENYEEEISNQSVKLQITGLRKKLPQGYIKNVYGRGYIFHI